MFLVARPDELASAAEILRVADTVASQRAVTRTLVLGYAEAHAFVAQPMNAVLLGAFVICAFHHAHLGMQVVVEDYIHTRWLELTLILTFKFTCFLAAAASLLAIVRIAHGS